MIDFFSHFSAAIHRDDGVYMMVPCQLWIFNKGKSSDHCFAVIWHLLEIK